MENQTGKIQAMPRIVYWVAMPENFKDKDKIEILQHDIWIKPINPENIDEISDERPIIILNLDSILFRKSHKFTEEEYLKAKTLMEKLETLKPLHTLAHTTTLSENLKKLFNKNGYSYLERNLYNTRLAVTSIEKFINLLYEKIGRPKRGYLRIIISKEEQIGAQMLMGNQQKYPADLVDVSMSGICLSFPEGLYPSDIKLKEFVKVNFTLAHRNVKIETAIIARIDETNRELGLYFEIDNQKMIKEDSASHFTATLYQWTKDILLLKEEN